MRYVIAMVCATITTLLAMRYVSGPVANWMALQGYYESSDAAETVNQMAFIVTNLGGLIIGWTIGWAIGAPFAHDPEQDAK